MVKIDSIDFFYLLNPLLLSLTLGILMLSSLIVVNMTTQPLIIVLSLTAILALYIIAYALVFSVMLDIKAETSADTQSCVRSANYNTVISYENDEVFDEEECQDV